MVASQSGMIVWQGSYSLLATSIERHAVENFYTSYGQIIWSLVFFSKSCQTRRVFNCAPAIS